MTLDVVEVSYIHVILPLASSILAGAVIVAGNYHLQRRVGQRLRTAEGLRNRLYTLLEMTSEYWTSSSDDGSARILQEARIRALTLIILAECAQIRAQSKKTEEMTHEDAAFSTQVDGRCDGWLLSTKKLGSGALPSRSSCTRNRAACKISRSGLLNGYISY